MKYAFLSLLMTGHVLAQVQSVTPTGGGITPATRAAFRAALDLPAMYQPLIADGSLPLAKLATDPLARANHTGTQPHTTITGLGTAATADLAHVDVTQPPYNATGDSVTDDTTAIQAAITVAKTAKTAVYFPPGNYKISGTLLLDWEGGRFFGSSLGIGSSRIVTTSPTLPAISVPADYNAIKIENLHIVGPGRATSTSSGINIRGDLGGGTNVDFGLLSDVKISGFDVGMYLKGVANSSVVRAAVENCNTAVHSLGNNNSNTFQNCAFVCADGSITGTIGVWLAAGRGNVIESCDMGGPTMETCVIDNAVSTLINGGQWEAYGTGLKTTADTSVPVVSGVFIGQFGTASADRYSMDLQVGATIIGGSQQIVNTTNGAAIKMRSTISRGLRYFGGSGAIKADFYASGVYHSTANVGGGLGVMTQANGESASATTLGVGWLRESAGSNLVYNFGVRNAAGAFAWANLLDYHFEKATAGSSAAFLAAFNTFTGSTQAIGHASSLVAPNWRIWTGTDVTQNRQMFGLVTAANQYATGTDTRDAVLQAQAGGDLLFLTGASGVNQTIRGRIKDSGVLNMAATPVYADNAAAISGGLVAGDEYRTSTGAKMEVYTP